MKKKWYEKIFEDLRNNYYKYIILCIVTASSSILTFIGATGGAILALPTKVAALEEENRVLEGLVEEIVDFNEQQVIFNEKQIVINDNIDKGFDDVNRKLNILIAK